MNKSSHAADTAQVNSKVDVKYRLAAAVMAATVFVGLVRVATAQEAPPISSDLSALPEVIVTAEKRSERAQDIPVTLSAISSSALDSEGIRNTDDLQHAVPSLVFTDGLNGSAYIRGVGAPITTAGNQPDVAMYVDGVLLISPLQATGAYNNVERVEVLEGPQGTLFGRNASGGVINIITPDPTQQFSAKGSVGYGNFQTSEAKLYVNVPITDTLAANVSGYFYNQEEGWGRNETTGGEAYREWSHDFRAKLRWTPDDKTDIIATFDNSYIHSDLTDVRILEGTLGVGGARAPTGWWDSSNDYPSYNSTIVDSASLRASFNYGVATFRSITAYTSVNTFWPYDSDGGNLPTIEGPIWDDASGFTQELQLISPNDQKVTWALGLYYLYDQAKFNPIQLFGTEFGPATVNVFGHTTTQSYATYGQGTWEFLPGTHLTLGGRYTIDYATIDGHTDVDTTPGVESYQSTKFSDPSYRGGLDHRFNSNVMIYGSVSTGFNAGQYNTGNAAAPAVQPEKLVAYEVGTKTDWLGGRLQANLSAYWYSFKDLQVAVTEQAVTVQTNAAAARIKGLELSLQAQPIHDLHLQAGFSYNDAIYTNYNNVQFYVPAAGGGYSTVVSSATGNYLVASPKIAATADAGYDLHTAIGTFDTTLSFSHKGRIYWDYSNAISTGSIDLINASVKWQPTFSDHWDVNLWGKNLTNREYNQLEGVRLELASAVPGAPRTYGITFEGKY